MSTGCLPPRLPTQNVPILNPKISKILKISIPFPHPLFLNVLPVVVVDAAVTTFAVDLTIPPEAVFFALPGTGFLVIALLPFPAVFWSTVLALPSLDSVLSLALRVVRAPSLVRSPVGTAVAVRFVRAAAAGVAPLELELELDVVVTFLSPPVRVPRFVAAGSRVGLPALRGELDLYRYDLVGDVARLRFAKRELDEVGDKTCAGCTKPPSSPRVLFLGRSPF